jgi:F-type H+/Na+-transporting ATPase subunit alpha
MLKPDEVTQALEKEISKYQAKLEIESVGYVLQVGDGIARVYGLENVMAGELVTFEDGTSGLVLNLEPAQVGVVILGDDRKIKEGGMVKRTGKIAEVPVGPALKGRVVNPLGEPLDLIRSVNLSTEKARSFPIKSVRLKLCLLPLFSASR